MWQPTTTSLSAATMSFMKVRPGLPLQNGGAAQRGRSGNQHQRRGSAGHAKAAMIKARTARLHASRSAQCSATDQASPPPHLMVLRMGRKLLVYTSMLPYAARACSTTQALYHMRP